MQFLFSLFRTIWQGILGVFGVSSQDTQNAKGQETPSEDVAAAAKTETPSEEASQTKEDSSAVETKAPQDISEDQAVSEAKDDESTEEETMSLSNVVSESTHSSEPVAPMSVLTSTKAPQDIEGQMTLLRRAPQEFFAHWRWPRDEQPTNRTVLLRVYQDEQPLAERMVELRDQSQHYFHVEAPTGKLQARLYDDLQGQDVLASNTIQLNNTPTNEDEIHYLDLPMTTELTKEEGSFVHAVAMMGDKPAEVITRQRVVFLTPEHVEHDGSGRPQEREMVIVEEREEIPAGVPVVTREKRPIDRPSFQPHQPQDTSSSSMTGSTR